MANLEKWAPSVSWTTCGFTASNFDSRASGQLVVATSDVDNSSNKDRYCRIKFKLEVGGTTTVGSTLAFLVMNYDADNSIYGDNSATGDTNPAAHQVKVTAQVKNGITSGNAVYGTTEWFEIPPSVFRFGVLQLLGSTTDASANATFKYETANIDLNG